MNQIESLKAEVERLRSGLEVLSNSLENAQRRQCDMYLDLDTRLRRFEEAGATVRPSLHEESAAHPRPPSIYREVANPDKGTSYKPEWRGRKVWVKLEPDRLPYEGIIVSMSPPDQIGRYNIIIRLSQSIVTAVRHVSRGREWDFIEDR